MQKKVCIDYEISAKVLYYMDEAIRNFKTGNVSQPVDLSDFETGCEASTTATEDV